MLVTDAEKAGVYTRGIASDKKGRGTAVNVDVYGYDEEKRLAVVQVRECRFGPGRFSQVRKDYYLLGYTESGKAFGHPVDSPARSRKALASPEATVAWAEARIWHCAVEDLSEVVRQGDVALVPARLPETAERLEETQVILRGTHRLKAERLYRAGDDLYAYKKVSVVHLNHEHRTVQVWGGIYRVVEGYKAPTWGFSAPSAEWASARNTKTRRVTRWRMQKRVTRGT